MLLILPVSAKATVALSANKWILSKLNSTGYFVVPSGLVMSIVAGKKPEPVKSLKLGVAVIVVTPSRKLFSTFNQGTELANERLSSLALN